MNSEKIIYEIVKAGHDLETIIVKSGGREYPLHSKVNPERDAELLRERFEPSRYDFLIILGTGLGYHCLPLKELASRYTRIVLVDILEGIDDAIRKNRLTSFLCSDPRITLVIGKTVSEVEHYLAENVDMDAIRGISVLEHPASMRIFSDYYRAVKKSVDKIINIKAGNKATRKAFGARYLRNILMNFRRLDSLYPVRHFFGAFAGYPAVIAGSGPSLDTDADVIQRNQERFFIIAADSALPVLLKRGIRPDIVISIDPQPYVQEHFLSCDTSDMVAVYSISSHPSAVASSGYLSLNSHPLAQLALEIYGGSVGSVDSGTGNVAGDAVSLAVRFGFSGIGITGFDFSFPGYTIYARGTAYQRRYGLYSQDRLRTVESLNMKYIMTSSGGFRHGGRFTRKSFLHYHQALEDFIRDTAVADLVSLNGRGMPLAGTVPMDMDGFIRRRCPAGLDKKGIIKNAAASSRVIGGQPLSGALGRIIDDEIFESLLQASLGDCINQSARKRYRDLALRAIQR